MAIDAHFLDGHLLGGSSDALWVTITLFVVGLSCPFFLPRAIIVTSEGILQRRLLKASLEMKWKDVISAVHLPTEAEIRIFGADGTEIIHSRYHVGRAQFLAEVAKRVRVISR